MSIFCELIPQDIRDKLYLFWEFDRKRTSMRDVTKRFTQYPVWQIIPLVYQIEYSSLLADNVFIGTKDEMH